MAAGKGHFPAGHHGGMGAEGSLYMLVLGGMARILPVVPS